MTSVYFSDAVYLDSDKVFKGYIDTFHEAGRDYVIKKAESIKMINLTFDNINGGDKINVELLFNGWTRMYQYQINQKKWICNI